MECGSQYMYTKRETRNLLIRKHDIKRIDEIRKFYLKG